MSFFDGDESGATAKANPIDDSGRVTPSLSPPPNQFKEGFLLKYFYNDGLGFLFFTENGTINIPATDHNPYFLTDTEQDAIKLQSIGGILSCEKIVKHDNKLDKDITFFKLSCSHPAKVPNLRSLCSSTNEDRIEYYHCYLMDKHIYPTMPYSFDGNLLKPKFAFNDLDKTFTERINTLNYRDDMKKYDLMKHFYTLLTCPIPKLGSFAIDCEVSVNVEQSVEEALKPESIINTVSIYKDNEKLVYTTLLGELKSPNYIRCDSEKELLLKFFYKVKELIKSNPIILTFNGGLFDFPKINQRAKDLGVLGESPFILNEEKNYTIKDGIHIDLWTWFSKGSVKAYVYDSKYIYNSLENISFSLLGKHKGETDFDNPVANAMCEYCLLDSQLAYELFEYKDRLAFSIICLLSRWGQVPIEQIVNNKIGFWIKTIFYSLHRDLNIVIPKPTGDPKKNFKGAIIIEPKAGTYFDVVIVDFASLYPSVIDTCNVGYDTTNCCSHSECEYAEEINVRICNRKRSIYSLLVGSMKDLRIKIFKPLGKSDSFFFAIGSFLKVLMNGGGYGVEGDFDQPAMYVLAATEFITWKSRESITKVAKKARELGITVLYGDTDSLMLLHPTKEQVNYLIKYVTDTMGMDLEVDKELKFFVIPQLKKNYLAVFKDGNYKIAGMVGKKIHTPEFIRTKFTECVKAITSSNTHEELEQSKMKALEIYKDAVNSILKGQVSLKDLAYHMIPSFDPADKIAKGSKGSKSQLYQVCKVLLEHNIKVEGGVPVAFVKTKKPSALPLQFATPEDINIESYVDNFKSVFSQLFEPLGLTVPDVRESTLEEYF